MENIINEIWRPIKGYEGLYEVSNLGRVKSLGNNKTKKDKILRSGIDSQGYPNIGLSKKGNRKTYNIHRIVAEAFIPNPENKRDIDHINNIKDDNRVENLRWCSHRENCNNPLSIENHKIAIQKRFPNRVIKTQRSRKEAWSDPTVRAKVSIPVLQLTKNGSAINYFPSQIEASRQTGLFQTGINLCINNKYKTCGGFRWMSFEDYEQYY